jgi:hypothetical protein
VPVCLCACACVCVALLTRAAVHQTELLFETTPVVARLYGWYWPTSERDAYQAEQGMLSMVRTAVTQRYAHSVTVRERERV